MPFVAAAAQFSPIKGALEANLDRISIIARKAVDEGADLCVFPESSISGYVLEGGAVECSMTPAQLESGLRNRLDGLKKPVDLLVGFYESHSGQPYNSAAYFDSQRGVIHVYRKFFLPTYGVFDEERFHSRGTALGIVDSRLGRFGILICEDVWHSILADLCVVAGADMLLVPSASPVRGMANDKPGNLLRYERMLKGLAEEHGVYALSSMLTGSEGGKCFSGGSMIFDPFGELLVQCPVGEEALVLAEIDFDNVQIARTKTPLVGDLKSAWANVQSIVSQIAPSE